MRNEIQIEKLGRPVMNRVLVSIKDTSDEFQTKGGIDVRSAYNADCYADSLGFNVSEFLPRSGVVVTLPSVISDFKYDYMTENELQVGDTVFWNLMSCRDMLVMDCDGAKYGQPDYHEILVRVRDGVVTPINGNVLLSAVEKSIKALEYTVVKKSSDIWKIERLPEKMPVSHIERRNSEVDWSVGDRVKLLVNQSPYRIEGELNKILDAELFCVPEHMILSTVNNLS